MRMGVSAAFSIALFVGSVVGLAPASASPRVGSFAKPEVISNIELAQSTRGGNRDFRRCMRAKYGPRYFAGVRRATRYHMAQACGG